jgi:hypothetical protein
MPLDTLARQTTVAELHYLKRTAERPARYVTEHRPACRCGTASKIRTW